MIQSHRNRFAGAKRSETHEAAIKPPVDSAAMASLVMGTLGILFGIASAVGAYLAIHSLQRIARSGGSLRGESVAITGLVVSTLSAFLWELALVALLYHVYGRVLGLPPPQTLLPLI